MHCGDVMVDTTTYQHVDVLIVGAGLSGIGGACHLRQRCPDKSFLLLEGRDSFGGTWDLFRFPGIRSDSDLYTYGYNFKPWQGKPIATARPNGKSCPGWNIARVAISTTAARTHTGR